MGIVSFDEERASKVHPTRLFKGLFTDSHNLVPKIAPQFIKGAAIIQGDGGVGSVIQVKLADGAPFPYFNYKIDELDEAKFICKYTLTEGGELNETIKGLSAENKLEPTADGGCLSKLKRVYTIAEGSELSLEELESHKLRGKMLFDGVEGFLLKNPDIYA